LGDLATVTKKRNRSRSRGTTAPATWAALSLAEPLETKLRTLAARARQRIDAPPSPDAGAITALFAGTGRTQRKRAVEVLAGELGLGIHRVALDRIVGTSTGETEKNFDHLFAETDGSATVLFLDEADGLFRRSGDVGDSHDRYANLEIEDLLRRLESFKGLVILAANGAAPDGEPVHPAIDYVVEFPHRR